MTPFPVIGRVLATGFVPVSRRLLDPADPLWGEPRKFSRWEALLDLIANTAWRNEQRRIGRVVVGVAPGEFVASERFLAQRWRWSRAAVTRFIGLLKVHEYIVPRRRVQGLLVYALGPSAAVHENLAGRSQPRASHIAADASDCVRTTSGAWPPERQAIGEPPTEPALKPAGELPKPPRRNALGGGVETLSGQGVEPSGVTNRGKNREERKNKTPRDESRGPVGSVGVAGGKYPHFPKADCDALYERYLKSWGAVPYDRFRKAFAPLYSATGPRHDVALLCTAIEVAHDIASVEDAFLVRRPSPEVLVGGMAEWVRLAAMPFVDEYGRLTELAIRTMAQPKR